MVNADVVAYNVAVLVSTLFLLEFGADKFVDHTAIVARRTGIPQAIIGLLTSGAEWEELAVVVASLARGRESLAIGNIIGAAISNILGAFSLGLLFRSKENSIRFDESSRIYSAFLLVLTTFATPVLYFSKRIIWLVCGALLIAIFVLYLVSIGWAIRKGRLTAPEGSDDEGDSSDDDESESSSKSAENEAPDTGRVGLQHEVIPNDSSNHDIVSSIALPTSSESSAQPTPQLEAQTRRPRRRRPLRYHVFFLLLGFFAICLSGYIISHAATTLTTEFGISDVLFGVIVLAIATTLPEKFVAVFSGWRGHVGILVATTAGSNVFLLTLCVGIIMLDTKGNFNTAIQSGVGSSGNVNIPELAVLWGSTLAFTMTVWFGGRFHRWIGVGMLLCYVAFIILEFTVIHGVH